MAIRITFSNGEEVTINFKTRLYAKKGTFDPYDQDFYTKDVYTGSLDDPFSQTRNILFGLQGLLSNSDWIAFGSNEKYYRTSAIVSIESIG